MSKIGFVYILTNDYMPNVYKVGCTERSPHERAAELSASTGVPAPFEVLCYIECHDFQAVETKVHGWLSGNRISNGREFFNGGLEYAVRLLFWMRGRLSFTMPCEPPGHPHGSLGGLFGFEEFGDLRDTVDPWDRPASGLDGFIVEVGIAVDQAGRN